MKSINTITAEQYARAIRSIDRQVGHELLEAHLAAPDHTATWQNLGDTKGMSWRGVNMHYGKFAHVVAELLGIVKAPKGSPESERGYWIHTLVVWADDLGSRGHTAFVLRKPVIQALQAG